MSQTLNMIKSDIRNAATSGSTPIDFRIEDSQIEYWIHQTRADLAAKDIQKRKDISTVLIQSVKCLELETVDKSECCDIDTNCSVLRTSLTIPRTIESNGTDTIIRVTDINGNLISRTSENAAKYDSYSKYTSAKAKWFLKDDYIYVINNEFLSKITVQGIFENPTELAAYVGCDGDACYTDSMSYPCSNRMASDIANIVLKTKVFPFLQIPQDTTNNSASDANQVVK